MERWPQASRPSIRCSGFWDRRPFLLAPLANIPIFLMTLCPHILCHLLSMAMRPLVTAQMNIRKLPRALTMCPVSY